MAAKRHIRNADRNRPVGHRFFIPIGVPRPGGCLRDLAAVPDDLVRLKALFGDGGLGYRTVVIPENPSALEVQAALCRWLAHADLDHRDAVVIYYSGHGIISGRDHFLCTRGFDADQIAATALKTEEVLSLVMRRKHRPGRLWLILDCCQAGGVLTEGLSRAMYGEGGDIFVLAASSSWGETIDGTFSAALCRVVAGPAGTKGASHPLSLDQLADTLNRQRLPCRVVQAAVSSSRFDLLSQGAPSTDGLDHGYSRGLVTG